ncbi:MAG: hypothetical protein RR091_09830 [Cloacibacillus sp.]
MKDREIQRPEGWERSPFSGRFHYFRNGESLCGKHKIETLAVRDEAPLKEFCCRQCFLKLMREP